MIFFDLFRCNQNQGIFIPRPRVTLRNNSSIFLHSNKFFISNHYLTVEKVEPKNYSQVAEIAESWAEIAYKKAADPEVKSEWEEYQFAACSSISSKFGYILGTEDKKAKRTYLCRDSKGKEQGMMLLSVKRHSIYIDFLTTNPRNIRSFLNDKEQDRVQGAGEALIRFAQNQALQFSKDYVYLHTVPKAEHFYKKMGFELIKRCRMQKTAERIRNEFPPPSIELVA